MNIHVIKGCLWIAKESFQFMRLGKRVEVRMHAWGKATPADT